MTDSDVTDLVEISGFRLDVGRRRLLDSDGTAVPLTSKAFDTLAYLVANPGRVVDKHELLDAVWPGVAVEENTLNHAISAVRRALGDCRTEPRFIATIQGRGYQFIAPVRATEGAVNKERTSLEVSAPLRALLGRRRGILLGIAAGLPAAALIHLTGFGRGGFSGRERPIEFDAGTSRQLTHDVMPEFDAALSPDGLHFAYAAGPLGQTDIYVRPVAGGSPRNLTEHLDGAHTWPRWSSDGERIAFLTTGPRSHDTIRIVSAAGGGDAALVAWAPHLTGHAWSPDGADIVYTRSEADSGLYRKSVADLAQPPILLARAYDPHSPAWSPDGSHIAFVSGNSPAVFSVLAFANIAPSAICVVAVDSGDTHAVTSDANLNLSPEWAGDSRSLFFVSDLGGPRDVYQAGLPGPDQKLQAPRPLTNGIDALSIGRSPEGDRLIVTRFVSRANISRLRIPEHGPLSPLTAEAVTTGNQTIESLDVSSDGQWLVFDSNLSGNQDIYKADLSDGVPIGEPIRLTDHSSGDFLPCFSPNDEQIAFHSFRNGNRDIFLMSASGDNKQHVTFGSAQERYPDWSPDGNRIVLMSDETDQQEAYIASRLADGTGWTSPQQITFHGGWYPKWSPVDERRIAYTTSISGQNSTLEVLTLDSSAAPFRQDLGPEISASYAIWSKDGQSIYLRTRSEGGQSLWSIPLDGSEPVELVRFEHLSPHGPSRPEFATDGRYFYFTLTERVSDIWMLQLNELPS